MRKTVCATADRFHHLFYNEVPAMQVITCTRLDRVCCASATGLLFASNLVQFFSVGLCVYRPSS